MKKISMFIVMLLTCILSFGYPHHHFYNHHVYHHHRPTTTYHRISTPKPKLQPHHRYVKDPVTNQVMLYFILTRGTNTYRHEGRDYVRCESCRKVFILKGKRFCKECIKTRRREVQRISKK